MDGGEIPHLRGTAPEFPLIQAEELNTFGSGHQVVSPPGTLNLRYEKCDYCPQGRGMVRIRAAERNTEVIPPIG